MTRDVTNGREGKAAEETQAWTQNAASCFECVLNCDRGSDPTSYGRHGGRRVSERGGVDGIAGKSPRSIEQKYFPTTHLHNYVALHSPTLKLPYTYLPMYFVGGAGCEAGQQRDGRGHLAVFVARYRLDGVL